MKLAMILLAFSFPLAATATDLYSDDWVEGMARMEIGPSHSAIDLKNPCLDVVPNGQMIKINEIFERLHLDPKKVIYKGSEDVMLVTFFEWQLSKGYLLSIMSGDMRHHSPFREEDAWSMQGYGVRIVRIPPK